jgi:endogenous inhibitor of DNA gyrase (YacG/DUF329 family)
MAVIDLNRWHHAVHQITGDMALRFNRAAVADLERWAKMLRVVAGEMEDASKDRRVSTNRAATEMIRGEG